MNVHHYGEALKPTGDTELPNRELTVLDLTTEIGKRQNVAKKQNSLVILVFTFAFTMLIMMVYIDKDMSAEWPEGHAGNVTKALFKKFKPKDVMSKVEMRTEILQLQMKEDEDPSNLFTAMTSIEVRYNKPMDTEEKLLVLLKVCPAKYKTVIRSEQHSKGTALTINDLEEAMGLLY